MSQKLLCVEILCNTLHLEAFEYIMKDFIYGGACMFSLTVSGYYTFLYSIHQGPFYYPVALWFSFIRLLRHCQWPLAHIVFVSGEGQGPHTI